MHEGYKIMGGLENCLTKMNITISFLKLWIFLPTVAEKKKKIHTFRQHLLQLKEAEETNKKYAICSQKANCLSLQNKKAT